MALREEDVYRKSAPATQPAKRSRITFDVSPELRRRIKIAATQNETSIGEYLGRILEQTVPYETSRAQRRQRPAASEILEELERVNEQVLRDSKGQLFEDSAEVLRQQREERTKYLEELRER